MSLSVGIRLVGLSGLYDGAELERRMSDFFEDCVADTCFNQKWRAIEEFGAESVGLPIGVVEDYPFEVVERPIAEGEIIVIFTDGVDEAMNPDGELYTLERMRSFLLAGPRQADELGRALLADVRAFADGRDQNDDITIMTFGRDAPA